MQDRHVTYRDIELSSQHTLDIAVTHFTAIYSIYSRWIPHNFTNAQNKIRIYWCKEMLEKYYVGASKDVYKIVTADKSWVYVYEPETTKTSQIQRKLFVEEALRSRWSPVSSAKLVMWRLLYLSIVGRSILNGTPQFVCLKSSKKLRKRTRAKNHYY